MIDVRRLAVPILALLVFAGCSPETDVTAAQTSQFAIQPENELERALVGMAREPSAQTEAAFEAAYLHATVYLVSTQEAVREQRRASSAEITYWKGPLTDGRHGIAVFTSPKRAAQVLYKDKEVPWIALSGRDTLRLADREPLVVNYGLEPVAVIEPDQARKLTARK
jgi:hypothetical protein